MDLLRVDLTRLAGVIRRASLLVQVNSRLAGVFSFLNLVLFLQVPKRDMLTFSLDELYTPLLTAMATGGVGLMGTVLLCETLLSLLPTMSTKDMPYRLLRDYDITLIGSGIMAGAAPVTAWVCTECLTENQTSCSPGFCPAESPSCRWAQAGNPNVGSPGGDPEG